MGPGKRQEMQRQDKLTLRRELDMEMGPFRRAGREQNPTDSLLRAVRQSLEIPIGEIAAKLGVVKSVVLGYEMGELRNTIQIGTMERVARAMGCRLVYGIVPRKGKTLEALAEERLWQQMLEERVQRSGVRDRKSRDQKSRDQGSVVTDQKGGERKSRAQELREEKFRDRGTGDVETRDVGTGDVGTEGLASSSQLSAFSSGELDRAEEMGDEEFRETGEGEMGAAGTRA
jgi:hypothetical protein